MCLCGCDCQLGCVWKLEIAVGMSLLTAFQLNYFFFSHWVWSSQFWIEKLAREFQGFDCLCLPILGLQVVSLCLHVFEKTGFLCLLSTGVEGMHYHTWGFELSSSWLLSKHFIQWTVSKVPYLEHFYCLQQEHSLFLAFRTELWHRLFLDFESEPTYQLSWAFSWFNR